MLIRSLLVAECMDDRVRNVVSGRCNAPASEEKDTGQRLLTYIHIRISA